MGADTIDYTARVSESVLARLHFVVRAAPGETLRDFDEAALESELADATRSWTDDLADCAARAVRRGDWGPAGSRPTARRFPRRTRRTSRRAVGAADVRRLEDVGSTSSILLSLYSPVGGADGEARFKVFRTGTPLSLSAVLPVLSSTRRRGRRRAAVPDRAGPTDRAWIYDFGLRHRKRCQPGPASSSRTRSWPCGAAGPRATASRHWCSTGGCRGARSRSCGPTRSTSGRAARRSARTTSRPACSPTCRSPGCSSTSSRRGSTRRATEDDRPDAPERRGDARSRARSWQALDGVASLDHDRILRSYLASSRRPCGRTSTSPTRPGRPKTYLSLKLEPREIPELPEPRPAFEIFVYSPRVEGVHLRFGPVARGGLRWSDRREDFRTEVLGLVKAQMVKNAVIVPVGSKGGFYCKAPARSGRRPRGVAGRGRRLLQDVHQRDCSTSPTTWSRARPCRRRAGRAARPRRHATSWSRRTRAPRRSPTSPTGWPRTTATGSATPSRRAARSATTTRRWASPPAVPGSRYAGTSASVASTARPRTSPASASAT